VGDSRDRGRWTGSGLPCFEIVEVRLRATTRFINLIDKLVAHETQAPGETYEEARRRENPYLRSPPLDVDALFRWSEAEAEFPLLAWSTSLAHCFSILESFLARAAAEAAALSEHAMQRPQRGGKIEAWLAELARHGAPLRMADDTLAELQALRRVRNALVHGLQLNPERIPPRVLDDLYRTELGEVVPTATIVRRALRAVDTMVGHVDVALMLLIDRLDAQFLGGP
jgi:hypothetical protein